MGAAMVSGFPNQLSRPRLQCCPIVALWSITPRCSVGCRPMLANWSSVSDVICACAPGPGGWTRPTSRSRAPGPTCIARSTASARRSTSCCRPGGMPLRQSGSSAKHLPQPHTVNPRTITVDKNPAYPRAAADMKRAGELWRFSRLRQCKYLNNIVEQDHRRIKRLVRPGLGFGNLRTARRTLAGYEAMAMIRKGQVHDIGDRDMPAQAAFVAGLFKVAA